MGINHMLLGTGTQRITEISGKFADWLPPQPGWFLCVVAGEAEAGCSGLGWNGIWELIAKGFLAPGPRSAADASPAHPLLLPVPRLLRRAAPVSVVPDVLEMLLKGQTSAKSLLLS